MFKKPLWSLVTLCLVFVFVACQEAPQEEVAGDEEAQRGVVEIIATYDPEANEHRFELSEDEVPSGWTTFRLVNASPDEHLAQIFQVPEDAGVTEEVWIDELIMEVQRVLDRFQDPEIDGMEEAREGADYPEWWAGSAPMGGPGLVSPGDTAEAMARLEPGEYILECYVKDSDEMMHTTLGMAAALRVTEEPSGAPEPDPDIDIALSDQGIEVSGDVEAGERTVRVDFQERDTTPGYRNVQLARLEDDTRVEEFSRWMNFWTPGSVAPAGFVGGTGRKPAGHATYFTIDLEPGDYAWVSEYPVVTDDAPDIEEAGWLKRFTVESP